MTYAQYHELYKKPAYKATYTPPKSHQHLVKTTNTLTTGKFTTCRGNLTTTLISLDLCPIFGNTAKLRFNDGPLATMSKREVEELIAFLTDVKSAL